MKRIVISVFAAAFVFTAANAQEITERKQDKPTLTEQKKGMESLNLSPEQIEKMKAIKEGHKVQVEELKKQGVSQEKIDALKQTQHDEIMALLTEEQKVEWKKVKDANKEKAAQDDKVKEKKAMAEQKAAKSENKEEIAAKIKAIQQDPTLTEEQKRDKTKELVQLLKEGQKKDISEQEMQKLQDRKKHTLDKKTTTN